MNSRKILYISYDGMCEPLGQSQVLSYLSRLAENWDVELLSFEKPSDLKDSEKLKFVESLCKEKGIRWHYKTYHKWPSLLATLYDVFVAWICVLKLGRSGLAVVHSRSYVAMLMGLPSKWFYKIPIVFDMRGFWADEKVDAGTWKKGLLYSLVKKLESYFVNKSDHIISLTETAVDEILSWESSGKLSKDKFSVVSTCVAADKFQWVKDFPEPICLGCVGGVQLWYDFPRALDLYNSLLKVRPEAKLHIVNQSEHEYIKKCLSDAGVSMENVVLESREHSEMAAVYKNFSFGVFFIRDYYSKKASMPTKLAEFMATGTPVITGKGIGDVDRYIESYDAGVLLDQEIGETDVQKIIGLLSDTEIRQRCRKMVVEEFSLDKAIASIDSIYSHLASQD